jgi:hypothetical protein
MAARTAAGIERLHRIDAVEGNDDAGLILGTLARCKVVTPALGPVGNFVE